MVIEASGLGKGVVGVSRDALGRHSLSGTDCV